MSLVATVQWDGDTCARYWLCLSYVLIIPAAPRVSLCAVNVYRGHILMRLRLNQLNSVGVPSMCMWNTQQLISLFFKELWDASFDHVDMINQEAGVLEQKSTVRKIKPFGLIFISRLNIKRPENGCFSKHDEDDSDYTHSTGVGLMGVQLLSTKLDIKSKTISLLKKLLRWLNWHQKMRAFIIIFYIMRKISKSWGLKILPQAVVMNRLTIALGYGLDYHLIFAITQSILYWASTMYI